MNRIRRASWALVAAVAGLGGATQNLRAQQPVDSPNAPAPTVPAIPNQIPKANLPTTTSLPQSHMIRALKKFDYLCDGENPLFVQLRGTYARVIFREKSYRMKQVEAAAGTKYSDGAVVWWSKGETGYLEDQSDPAKNEVLAKSCKLQKENAPAGNTVNPAAPAKMTDTITGTITYRQKIAMPKEADVIVQLQDVANPNGGAKIVAEATFPFGSRQVPIPFEVKFDPAKIDLQHPYAMTARIFIGTQLQFMNAKEYSVLTKGHGTRVNMVLMQVEPVTRSAPGAEMPKPAGPPSTRPLVQ